MEDKKQEAAISAFVKTLEYLAKQNLIMCDSVVLDYGKTRIIDYDPASEVEQVGLAFKCISGFAETFKQVFDSEYNRLRPRFNINKNEDDGTFSITRNW